MYTIYDLNSTVDITEGIVYFVFISYEQSMTVYCLKNVKIVTVLYTYFYKILQYFYLFEFDIVIFSQKSV